jgi:hypothetical protein
MQADEGKYAGCFLQIRQNGHISTAIFRIMYKNLKFQRFTLAKCEAVCYNSHIVMLCPFKMVRTGLRNNF